MPPFLYQVSNKIIQKTEESGKFVTDFGTYTEITNEDGSVTKSLTIEDAYVENNKVIFDSTIG